MTTRVIPMSEIVITGSPVYFRGAWWLVSSVSESGSLELRSAAGERVFDVDVNDVEHPTIRYVGAEPVEVRVLRTPKEEAADVFYGEGALAAAIADWADLLEHAERLQRDSSRAGSESVNVSMYRVVVCAVVSAMRHTAEAARMVHASSCKRGGERA